MARESADLFSSAGMKSSKVSEYGAWRWQGWPLRPETQCSHRSYRISPDHSIHGADSICSLFHLAPSRPAASLLSSVQHKSAGGQNRCHLC